VSTGDRDEPMVFEGWQDETYFFTRDHEIVTDERDDYLWKLTVLVPKAGQVTATIQ